MTKPKKSKPRVRKPAEKPILFDEFKRQRHEEGLRLLRYAITQTEIHERASELAVRRILPEQQPEPTMNDATFSHTENYRSVTLRGENFNLTKVQAQIIETLHKAAKSGRQGMHQNEIRENGGRLRDAFRNRGMRAWEALVKRCGKGFFRLNV